MFATKHPLGDHDYQGGRTCLQAGDREGLNREVRPESDPAVMLKPSQVKRSPSSWTWTLPSTRPEEVRRAMKIVAAKTNGGLTH